MKQEELNDKLRLFLIENREKAGLSQSDVAARSEIFGIGKTLDQRAVSRIENQPISVDAIKIAGYLSAVGIQPKKYYELLTEYTYRDGGEFMSSFSGDVIKEKVIATKKMIFSARSRILDFNHEYIDSSEIVTKLEQLDGLLDSLNRKPVIGCFGHFDAGKSTLLNTIINQSVLPEKYQPATCVVNLLMHESDRPATLSGSVAIFKKGFKPHMIHSDDAISEYMIKQGGIEILEKLGVHNYEENVFNDAYMAIVFSDAEILKSIWLLDTPGDLNGSDDSDTEKALGGVELADGVIFVSNHTGFFKDSDLGFASNIIRQRPPVDRFKTLEHLLFVQSHCHSEIKREDVDDVGRVVFNRIKKQLDNLIFTSWLKEGFIAETPQPLDLTSRVQPFWRENEEYRTNTLKKVSQMAAFLNENHEMIVEKYISDVLKNAASIIMASIDSLNNKKSESIDRVREVNEKDARFREQSVKLVVEFNSLIQSCVIRKQSDLDTMSDYFKYNTSVDGLEEIINDTYSEKKEAQSEIGNYIGQLLTAKLESTLKTSSKAISDEIESLLARWQEAAPTISTTSIKPSLNGMDFDVGDFNSRAAFVGGLAGLGSLGAMAFYVSTIASNLGAYILVGKAAGVLVSLGLVGSVTTVTSFVAAIGGPITIGIALAAAIGYLMFRLVGGSWQKLLAKKFAEAVKKENVFDNIKKIVNEFWESTAKAIDSGLQELIKQTDEYIKKLKSEAATEYSVSELDACMVVLKNTLEDLK